MLEIFHDKECRKNRFKPSMKKLFSIGYTLTRTSGMLTLFNRRILDLLYVTNVYINKTAGCKSIASLILFRTRKLLICSMIFDYIALIPCSIRIIQPNSMLGYEIIKEN